MKSVIWATHCVTLGQILNLSEPLSVAVAAHRGAPRGSCKAQEQCEASGESRCLPADDLTYHPLQGVGRPLGLAPWKKSVLVPWICRALASLGARQVGWFSDHWGFPWAHPMALSLVVPAPHLLAP